MSRAAEILRAAVGDAGIVASVEERANYRRIWARDAVISGLAGVAAGDEVVIGGLLASLETLAAAAGPRGEIPSNVGAGPGGSVSFGGLAGRLDCNAWFAIGACALGDRAAHLRPLAIRAMALYDVWELNGRGLVFVPPGGCWADEYPISGYTLTEQLLRLWALRELGDATAGELADRIAGNYDVGGGGDYHRGARERAPRIDHLAASFAPTGYDTRFDGLANALAIRLGVGDVDRIAAAMKRVAAGLGGAMVPAFWPPIEPGDPDWPGLEAMAAHGFRNRPGAYHNGGRWPMVNGFYGLALLSLGDRPGAVAVLEHIRAAGCAEFIDAGGIPGGATPATWSAAAEVWLAAAIDEVPPEGAASPGATGQ